jgi:hypothetical protein
LTRFVLTRHQAASFSIFLIIFDVVEIRVHIRRFTILKSSACGRKCAQQRAFDDDEVRR